MTEIYLEISKLTDTFRTMAYGLTNDKNTVDEAVQELMIYFLQMNKKTLSDIWNKDKQKGIIKYGAVALRRALTSPRSNFFYKYKKYYTHIDSLTSAVTYDAIASELQGQYASKHLYNIPNELSDD